MPRNTQLNLFGFAKYYYEVKQKLKYKDILTILNEHHGFSVTLRQLKEIFRKNGFNRKRNVDHSTLEAIITNEIGKKLFELKGFFACCIAAFDFF